MGIRGDGDKILEVIRNVGFIVFILFMIATFVVANIDPDENFWGCFLGVVLLLIITIFLTNTKQG